MPSYNDNADESAALNDALTSSPAALCSDVGEIGDGVINAFVTPISETACMNDAVVQVTAYLIIESAMLSDAVSVAHNYAFNVTESGYLRDDIALALLTKLADTADSAALGDALELSVATDIEELAAIGDAMTYALTASDEVIESGRLGDELRSYLSDVLADSAALNDAVAHVLRAVELIVEQAQASDAAPSSNSAATLIVEVAALADAAQQTAQAFDAGEELAILDDRVTGGGAGTAWLSHLETFAMSRWTNQPWNSMAVVDGRLMGASDDGLYVLDGADDAGAEVSGVVQYDWLNAKVGRDGKPVQSPQLKRPRYLYLEYKGGPLVLTLGHIHNGSDAEAIYTMPIRTANTFVNGRVELGRGIRSVHLRPRLTGSADFSISDGRLSVDELERSIA